VRKKPLIHANIENMFKYQHFLRIKNPLVLLFIKAFSFALYLFVLSISYTIRCEIRNQTGFELKKKQFIYAIWHQNTFFPLFLHRSEDISMFVDNSINGKIFRVVLELLGYSPIPLDKAPARSMVKMRIKLREKHNVCMAVDGPNGPALIPKDGTKWLTQLTGVPTTAMNVHYSRAITLVWRWDKYQIPVPFSRFVVTYSQLYHKDSDWSTLEDALGGKAEL
jgi:lysophospholipid acyltransferase (LPLAT)-like uncharacterized protein